MNRDRKHIRLYNHNYSSNGLYFITICTYFREHFFGEIHNDKMFLNEIGKTTEKYLKEIPDHFLYVEMDEFTVMPNHVHCILILDKSIAASSMMPPQFQSNQFSKPIAGSVSVIIQQFKSSVTKWCNRNKFEYFGWQSRFHDHVIRNRESYERIKNYIINNPKNWDGDSLR